MSPEPAIGDLPEPPIYTLERRPAPPPPPPTPRPAPARTARRSASIRGATIIVDPGHGGRDPGARGLSALPEKTVNLKIATRVAALLSSRGASVTMTRTSDRFVELDDRAALAESKRVALFVSVHADANNSRSISGATIYVGRGASSASLSAAQHIQSAFRAAGIACRGIRDAGFRVLIGHSRPAVLVECGYLTNRQEAQLLNTVSYQVKIANAIADGIAGHFGG
ncbi:MAG: N-acetylmuramoyl-L-alanine amidase [Phycisphaerae bacterium]|nr:N-acetylmuramoyl-L-alanine amidase [Phycisphaerae bacterium]